MDSEKTQGNVFARFYPSETTYSAMHSFKKEGLRDCLRHFKIDCVKRCDLEVFRHSMKQMSFRKNIYQNMIQYFLFLQLILKISTERLVKI